MAEYAGASPCFKTIRKRIAVAWRISVFNYQIMAVVHKSVLLAYSAEQMFVLVERVEDYPKFLPWCGDTAVQRLDGNKVVATIGINYRGVKQSFTTENINSPSSSINMVLVQGPFKHLHGEWSFKSLRTDACKVEFQLQYEFSSKLLEQIIGPVFNMITNSFVDSFCKRAEVVYGR
jgi:ribosome-associated toxin RatA of RatAB toxin-antitoxin module